MLTNETTSQALTEEAVQERIERLILLVTTHETGHYIVSRALLDYRSSRLLTILPSEDYEKLGEHVSEEMPNIEKRKEDYVNEIAGLLAGTVAEKMFLTEEFIKSCNALGALGNISDLNKALKLANKIAPEYCFTSHKICSACNKWPKHLRKYFLESAKNRIMEEAEELARKTILEHKEQYIEVRKALIIKRKLTGEELEKLYNENLKK